MELIRRLSSEFEGHQLTTLTVNGQPAWVAKELGVVLGYADPNEVTRSLRTTWADEAIEGKDYRVVKGGDLADLKRLYGSDPQSPVEPRTPSLVLLYEGGLNLILMRTDKPLGKRLRRFIIDEVLPQLARTGEYTPTREVRSGKVVEKVSVSDRFAVQLKREERLAEKNRLEARKIQMEEGRELLALVERFRARGMGSPEVLVSYEVEAAAKITGTDLRLLKPVVDPGWESPSEIAARLGVSSQRIGRVITKLELRGKDGMSRAVLNKAPGHDRTVETNVYSPAAVAQIEREVKGEKEP